MMMKEDSEKAGLKLNIRKMKIMASDPITSWQIDGETMETVRDFIFWLLSIIPYGRKWIRTKEPHDESERREWKSWFKNLNIQKMKIMASGPITSWQINGETMETVRDFIFWGSKITADGDYSHEIKRRLLLGRKAMTNLDSILKDACSLEEKLDQPRWHNKKQRHYFSNKGPSSQSCGFSNSHVWM